jgi:hypothetical protein
MTQGTPTPNEIARFHPQLRRDLAGIDNLKPTSVVERRKNSDLALPDRVLDVAKLALLELAFCVPPPVMWMPFTKEIGNKGKVRRCLIRHSWKQ